jgi:CheY-like chemotaxis protein
MARKALVADDDKDARFLWAVVAREFELEVVEASNGREALELLAQDIEIGLVVLDVMMPLLTGYKVLHEMRSDDRLKAIPVIISTANRTTQALDEIVVDDRTSFVNKASGIDNMRRGIARALGRPE